MFKKGPCSALKRIPNKKRCMRQADVNFALHNTWLALYTRKSGYPHVGFIEAFLYTLNK